MGKKHMRSQVFEHKVCFISSEITPMVADYYSSKSRYELKDWDICRFEPVRQRTR